MKQTKTTIRSVAVGELGRSYDKCLAWFYAFPNARAGLSNLAKAINASKTATKQAVESLQREAFLIRDDVGKAWLISANQKHPYFRIRKVPYHINKIYESGVLDAVYNAVPQARAIILFGSYRWGTDNEESDIDIAVEVVGDEKLRIVQLGTIREFGYRKNVLINMHVFSRNKVDLNLFSNIANGIVLDGFLEVRP